MHKADETAESSAVGGKGSATVRVMDKGSKDSDYRVSKLGNLRA